MNFDSKDMTEGKAFLMKPKHHFIYPDEENLFMMPIMKKKRLLYASMSVLIDGRTLILRKIVEKKGFQVKPKYQCHPPQLEEYVYGTKS